MFNVNLLEGAELYYENHAAVIGTFLRCVTDARGNSLASKNVLDAKSGTRSLRICRREQRQSGVQ
jgi:hypothetical protein